MAPHDAVDHGASLPLHRLGPLIIVSDPNRYTLSLGLATVYAARSRQIDLVMAGSVMAAVPTIIVFIALRKQLLDGLTAGAVK